MTFPSVKKLRMLLLGLMFLAVMALLFSIYGVTSKFGNQTVTFRALSNKEKKTSQVKKQTLTKQHTSSQHKKKDTRSSRPAKTIMNIAQSARRAKCWEVSKTFAYSNDLYFHPRKKLSQSQQKLSPSAKILIEPFIYTCFGRGEGQSADFKVKTHNIGNAVNNENQHNAGNAHNRGDGRNTDKTDNKGDVHNNDNVNNKSKAQHNEGDEHNGGNVHNTDNTSNNSNAHESDNEHNTGIADNSENEHNSDNKHTSENEHNSDNEHNNAHNSENEHTNAHKSDNEHNSDNEHKSDNEHNSDNEHTRGPFLMVLVLSSYLKTAAGERKAIRDTYGSVANADRTWEEERETRKEGRETTRDGVGKPQFAPEIPRFTPGKLRLTPGKPAWPAGKELVAPVGLVFLLGKPPTTHDLDLVKRESRQHGDLLVADFKDSYNNLTIKVLTGLHWVVSRCRDVKYVMKIDDDIFANLPLITAFLKLRGKPNKVYGAIYQPSYVRRSGRWGVPYRKYRFAKYPRYASGTSYILSRDAADKVVQASLYMPRFHIEDAYVTGILTQVTNVGLIHVNGFARYYDEATDKCTFLLDKKFMGHRIYAEKKRRLWNAMKSDNIFDECHK